MVGGGKEARKGLRDRWDPPGLPARLPEGRFSLCRAAPSSSTPPLLPRTPAGQVTAPQLSRQSRTTGEPRKSQAGWGRKSITQSCQRERGRNTFGVRREMEGQPGVQRADGQGSPKMGLREYFWLVIWAAFYSCWVIKCNEKPVLTTPQQIGSRFLALPWRSQIGAVVRITSLTIFDTNKG